MNTIELRSYDSYRFCCSNGEAAEALQKIAYEYSDPDITNELEDVLYQIEAMAQNEYNKDYYRVLYNVIMQIAENYQDNNQSLVAYNIQWDTDGEEVYLPDTMEIPEGITDYDEISDFLSEMTGYCHFGFELR